VNTQEMMSRIIRTINIYNDMPNTKYVAIVKGFVYFFQKEKLEY